MVIENGNTPDADEVMAALGVAFKNQSELIFNADLIGFDSDLSDSGTPDFEKLKFDTLQINGSTVFDTTNSELLTVPVYGATPMDEFADSSIDSAIWTTTEGDNGNYNGTIAENTERIRLSFLNSGGSGAGTTIIQADQASAFDFNTDSTMFTRYGGTLNSSANQNMTISLILSDGSTDVTLKSDALTPSSTLATQDIRVEIDPTADNAQVHTNDLNAAGGGSAIDISSLSNAAVWDFRIQISINNSNINSAGSCDVFFVRTLSNAVATNDFISAVTTSGSTITNAILAANDDTTNGSIAYFLSADNGANFEAVTLNQIHRFTNTGTQLQVKAELTNTASDLVPFLNHYAVTFNYY